MNELLINEELHLQYPDGFHVMDDAELTNLTFAAEGPGKCLSDPERHIIITIGHHRVNFLVSAVLSVKDIAKNAGKIIARQMSAFEYRQLGPLQRVIGGETSEGFRYTYLAQNIPMMGETDVVKRGKTLYYFHLYYRKELEADSLPVWEEILSSVRFS